MMDWNVKSAMSRFRIQMDWKLTMVCFIKRKGKGISSVFVEKTFTDIKLANATKWIAIFTCINLLYYKGQKILFARTKKQGYNNLLRLVVINEWSYDLTIRVFIFLFLNNLLILSILQSWQPGQCKQGYTLKNWVEGLSDEAFYPW